MPNALIQIYSEEAALHTAERKQLHAAILEHIHLGEFKTREFIPALKRLCFKGEIESFNQRILDPGEMISRINPLGTDIHAYLCLASPVVSEAFFVSILQRYPQQAITDMGIEVVRRMDGNACPGPELHTRIRCLVGAVRQIIPEDTFQYLSGRMFSRFLSRVCYGDDTLNGESSAYCLVVDWWEVVDQFIGLREDLESTQKLATRLFGGRPETPDAYQDARFLQFCEQYFARRFGAHLLAFLDEVYHAIPQEQRIRVENGAIAAPSFKPWKRLEQPMETAFCCLLRSNTATHSQAVEQFLGNDRPLDEDEVPEPLRTTYRALEAAAYPELLQRVDPCTVLLGCETALAPDAGKEVALACTDAGCQVLAPVLWLESSEVLHLHGWAAGEAWRFSRANACGDGEALEVDDELELLILMQASLSQQPTGGNTSY